MRTALLVLPLAAALASPQPARTGKQLLGDIVGQLQAGAFRGCIDDATNRRALDGGTFLLERLNQTSWKVSAEYKKSIAGIHEALIAKPSCDIVRTVLRDLVIKADDCRAFGMGRDIPLVVRTRKDGVEVRGWQVFTRWTNGRLLGADKPLRKLSSPAEGELPPGEYVFQARKPGSDLRSEPLRFSVGGSKIFECEIPVP